MTIYDKAPSEVYADRRAAYIAASAARATVPQVSRDVRAALRTIVEPEPMGGPNYGCNEFEPDRYGPAVDLVYDRVPGLRYWLGFAVYGYPRGTADDEATALDIFGPEAVETIYRYGPN